MKTAKKASKAATIKNDMRTEYKRSDFGVMERGKFYEFAVKATKAVVLRPEIAKAFPTSEAVNDALATMLHIASEAKRVTAKTKKAA
jgi:hypothetical protein